MSAIGDVEPGQDTVAVQQNGGVREPVRQPLTPAGRWVVAAAVAVGAAVFVQGLYAVATLGRTWQVEASTDFGSEYLREVLAYFTVHATASAAVAFLACTTTLAARPASLWLRPLPLLTLGALVAALAVSLVMPYVSWSSMVFQASDDATLMRALFNWPELVAISAFPTAAAAWTLLRMRPHLAGAPQQ
ncbi:hypothetical protein [Streptomyces sp. N35]|uniref:hypothetical protein n=1 Tax=Streptomyces sp. N35 TaxID=2795730 RepID=UPI0018F5EF00|nr:hypothetical protein [Streptomyces sp. N35]